VTRRPRQRLEDILEAVAVAQTIAERGRQDFDDDPVARLAAEAAVTRIGEAARHLPEEVTALAADVPWAQIRGMRNVMAHAYFDIEIDVLLDHDRPRPSHPRHPGGCAAGEASGLVTSMREHVGHRRRIELLGGEPQVPVLALPPLASVEIAVTRSERTAHRAHRLRATTLAGLSVRTELL
jgi:uncharacterized protein with HEPN domain